MADVKRPNRLDETAIAERRRKVLQLYLRHQTQAEIGRVLGCDQATVSLDLSAIRQQWTEANLADFDEIKLREAAELDEMEAEAAVEFSKHKRWEWFDRRLKVKERRARLLGLDSPARTDSNVNMNVAHLSDAELVEQAMAGTSGLWIEAAVETGEEP